MFDVSKKTLLYIYNLNIALLLFLLFVGSFPCDGAAGDDKEQHQHKQHQHQIEVDPGEILHFYWNTSSDYEEVNFAL